MMHMVDMSMSPAEAQAENGPYPVANAPRYPYGLQICLGPEEIAKLDLDDEDCCVGDILHIHAFAKVTSYSKRDTESGSDTRIELVLAFMEVEDEDDENEDDEEEEKPYLAKLYTR